MKLVDVVIATPSMLMPHDPADYPNMKTVAVAGEPCPKSKCSCKICPCLSTIDSSGLADSWATKVQFYHCCGPTEVIRKYDSKYHSATYDLSIGHCR